MRRKLDPRLAGRRVTSFGRKLHVHDPAHPLARPDGWVVAARWLAAHAHPTPSCVCGKVLSWLETPRAQVVFLDGDTSNLTVANLRPSCHSCGQAARFVDRPRDGRGRWRR